MIWKYMIQVNGMMFGMYESHVNNAIRKAFPVKKVTSSRSKNKTTVIAETKLDEDALCSATPATGYDERFERSPEKRKGCSAGRELGHRSMERRQMDAGGTYGRPRELGAGDARRTGMPVLAKEWAVSLDSPAGASEPA